MRKSPKISNKDNITVAIYNNSYTPIVPWIKSIGFCTNQLSYKERSSLFSIAENYLINSTHKRNEPQNAYSIFQYLNESGMTMVSLNGQEDTSGLNKIELPEGTPLDLELGQAIVKRRSVRKFSGDGLRLDYLATLLRSGCGISSERITELQDGNEIKFSFRTYSSAGALYPVDLYVAALKVNGLFQELYKYSPCEDALFQIKTQESCKKLLQMVALSEEQINLSQANAVLLFVIKPWKTMRKYGSRGLRFAFFETGEIAQNINLAISALGIGCVDCASFYEDEVNELLGLDGVLETFVHALIIGTPS